LFLTAFYRPTWVEINLDAVTSNVRAFLRALPEGTDLMAVVKANGYGHGAYEVAKEALAAGAKWLGVAFLDEALQLRQNGINCPILVMGYTDPAGFSLAIQHDISIAVYQAGGLELLAEASRHLQCKAKVHIKVDTGMGRLGLTETTELLDMVRYLNDHPWLDWEGLFTHYACADELDKRSTLNQAEKLENMIQVLQREGFEPPLVHAGNSATGIDLPKQAYGMVRLGISLYGLYPSDQVMREKVELQPVLTWKTKIVHLKQVPPGTPISYGSTYVTSGEERIATLPVGYADGYTRLLTGKGEVLVRGHRVPIVGRICMDQLMIHVTDVPDAAIGDEVVLIGSQGDERITADDVAKRLGTINYEIPCKVGLRVPRVYLKEGSVAKTANYIN
jgi:alanine racemase